MCACVRAFVHACVLIRSLNSSVNISTHANVVIYVSLCVLYNLWWSDETVAIFTPNSRAGIY